MVNNEEISRLVAHGEEWVSVARALAKDFAATAVERDKRGGTPKAERDALRHSQMLALSIPQDRGGAGESWPIVMRTVREISKADGSLGHVYGYHHLQVATPHLLGGEGQRILYYTETSTNRWFWANALNPRSEKVVLTRNGSDYYLSGTKTFSSGVIDSDILTVSATLSGVKRPIILVIPTNRTGVETMNDWDNMGQRQTDSVSVRFNNVLIREQDILLGSVTGTTTYATLRACLAQLTIANVLLGIACGAFDEASTYTSTLARPWIDSGLADVSQDSYILSHFGHMLMDLTAAEYCAEAAAEAFQQAWERDHALSPEERGHCAIKVGMAKTLATKVGLDVTSRVFDAMGTGATMSRFGFDRFWRNLRTLSLHNPISYTLRDLGAWALKRELPKPGFYS